MTRIIAIVEGHGEVSAVPILLRRIGEQSPDTDYIDVPQPIRTKRDRFIRKDEEFRRMLLLAAAKAGQDGKILILLDADDNCPAQLGPQTLERAQQIVGHIEVSVVIAKQEYEAWFIAAISSLAGQRGLQDLIDVPDEPEAIGGAKEWLTDRMDGSRAYRETLDQPAMSQLFDIEAAQEHSPSFDKLFREVTRLCEIQD